MKEEDRFFAKGCLTALQMIAMGLCALVLFNMLIDEQKAPVPVCPLQPDTTTPVPQ